MNEEIKLLKQEITDRYNIIALLKVKPKLNIDNDVYNDIAISNYNKEIELLNNIIVFIKDNYKGEDE